jgi:hypothetical protein
MSRFLLCICVLISCMVSEAQTKDVTKTIDIWGHIRDSFTNASIVGVKVTLMSPDSTIIDTTRVFDVSKGRGIFDATYKFTVPAVPRHYIIKASHRDYDDAYVDLNIKYVRRNTFFDAKWHSMKRRNKPISTMDRELGEVVVKASKVRFAYHGDTLVYNANAFNVPEGSMLDGLLKQMDGVEVDNDGNITVNGRHVDYLTLNGSDFFKGKNLVMLKNLPYYTVQKVEFFNKSSERSKVVGFDLDKRDFVGNVQLKREYSIGYMGNVEIGGGVASQSNLDGNTDIKADRYLARGFGLRYTGNTRLALMGGLNNVGKSTGADGSGNWNDYENTRRMSTKSIIANLMLNGKGGNISNETNCFVSDNRTNNQQRLFQENYLLEDRTFEQNLTSDRSKQRTFMLDNTFKINQSQGSFPFYFRSKIFAEKESGSSTVNNSSMMYGANPLEEGIVDADTIHQQRSANSTCSDQLQFHMMNDATVKCPWGDHVDLKLFGDYIKGHNDANLLKQYRFWRQSAANIDENRYDETPKKKMYGGINIDYSFDWLSGWRFELATSYRKDYTSNDYDYYRLDRLGGKYADFDPGSTNAVLPSTRDSLLMCRDTDTSNEFRCTQDWVQDYLKWSYTRNKDGNYVYFDFLLSSNYYHRHLDYRSATQNYNVYKDNSCFYPSVQYEIGRDNMRKHFFIHAYMSESLPDETDILDITDRTDTLAIRKGNPDLKKTTEYKVSSYYQTRGNNDFHSNISFDGSIVSNAVAQGYVQDATTGIRTYQPQNVDGNWNAGAGYDIGGAVDKDKHFHWALNTSYRFSHSVDLAGTTEEGESQLSTVLSHSLSLKPTMKYDFNKLSVRVTGKVDWYNYHRRNDPLQGTQNIFKIQYGGDCVYTFHFKLQASTDITMYSNRGFEDNYMNINKLLWNAQLTYPFCKGKLLAKLICSDILGQRSNIEYEVNAQGRTEKWVNSIGRYLILTLQWKIK